MNRNIINTNLRFNLKNPEHKKAWDYLQSMDKEKFKSYSNVIVLAVNEFFERHYHIEKDPFFETREREKDFVKQIVAVVKETLIKEIPVLPNVQVNQKRTSFDDIDLDFIGNE